jgi:8-oxo-dGTP pyrophosphatase MutT (NUDIX family)
MALRPWEQLGAEDVVDNRWYRLRQETVQLPSGRVVDDYFVSERADVALVFAVTDENRVILVRQWKQGRRAFLTELPGGVCDPGEDPADTAARELLEETGYACDALDELGRFEPDPTNNTNVIVSFAGRGARRVADPRSDDQEEIEVELLPLEEVRPAIRAGRISSAGTVATIYRALDAP